MSLEFSSEVAAVSEALPLYLKSDAGMALNPAWYVGFTAVLALLPLILGTLTSYIKISVVLGMMRSGLGAQQVPGNLVIAALAIALSGFVMAPVFEESLRNAEKVSNSVALPQAGEIPNLAMLTKLQPLVEPWRAFLEKHAGAREKLALQKLAVNETPSKNQVATTEAPTPLRILFPAFILSELKEAFAMGFVLLLPFLIIDLVVANILAGMGMYMVSPVMISLPLKLILFVTVDGWILLTRGLVHSYGG
jgi:type III secretion protein R